MLHTVLEGMLEPALRDDQARAQLYFRFDDIVAKAPERACVRYRGQTFDYRTSCENVELIARMIQRELAPGEVLAIIADRGPLVVWSMLAALRLGVVFTVIDAAYPESRIRDLLAIARPGMVLCCTQSAVAEGGERPMLRMTLDEIIDPDPDLLREPAPPIHHGDVGDPAYYLFTSGSTGAPKCIACSHAPLSRFIDWHVSSFDLRPDDRFSMLSGLSHDPVLRDIMVPLSIGACIIIPEDTDIREPGALRRFLGGNGISVAHLTPPMGELLLSGRAGAGDLPLMRHFFWGGDQLLSGLVNAIHAIAPAAAQTNFFGSTETPQAAAFHRCQLPCPDGPVPVGKGAADHAVSLVDEDGGPIAAGAQGHLQLRSRHLALGYVKDGRIETPPDFVTGFDGMSVYRTGDVGHANADGDILLDGRLDDQVKIRGYRVDPSEIARRVEQHPAVSSARALPINAHGAVRIACFVAAEQPVERGVLAEFVAAALPAYMIPSSFHHVGEALPLLPNGKVDRQALRQLAEDEAMGSGAISAAEPGNPRAAALMESWGAILHRNVPSPACSFEELEGDSLSYVQAYMALEDIAGSAPENWTELSIAELTVAPATAPGVFAQVESVIMLRGIAIILIVALHADLTRVGEAITSALFMVSGYLFGKSEWAAMFRSSEARRMLRPVINLLPLTAFFTFSVTLLAVTIGHRLSWPSLLLSSDLMDQPPGEALIRSLRIYWYLHSLLKLLLIAFALQWALGRHFRSPASQLGFLCTATLVLFSLRLGAPLAVLGADGARDLSELSVFVTNPLATLPLFYLGLVLSAEMTLRSRIAIMAAVIALAIANSYSFGTNSSVFIVISAFLVLFVRSVPVPRFLRMPLGVIAASTFTIYLVHTLIERPLKLLLPQVVVGSALYPWLLTAAGISAGIGLGAMVERVRRAWRSSGGTMPLPLFGRASSAR